MRRDHYSTSYSPVAEAGYCAPYLYLLEDDDAERRGVKTSHTKRKLEQVARAIWQGRGQGRGDSYSPWIRITRRFSSPVSNQEFAHIGVHRRNHHFLSTLEYHTALQLAFLGATELRECLPMWPTPHPHPLQSRLHEVSGLLEVAREAGIDHGVFVGTQVPYIGSLDMMVAFSHSGATRYHGVSCKPTEILMQSKRAQERVELDRRYCQLIGASHTREGGDGFDMRLIRQLETYKPTHLELVTHRGTSAAVHFCGHFECVADSMPMYKAIEYAGKRVGVTAKQAALLWRVGVWSHAIDIDMRIPLSMCKPIARGRDLMLSVLKSNLLGSHT